ncbi:unnamed protein product [Sphenostylis stenocarpa]|uniref:Uncharacterized protein n=1 Tax=Sphenostylis stenocarpa TaxID=92480 RepID=A0AA86W3F8_9FABA|nr:unnamed protein product [Sphenostylis stenocarpa]
MGIKEKRKALLGWEFPKLGFGVMTNSEATAGMEHDLTLGFKRNVMMTALSNSSEVSMKNSHKLDLKS